jgi:hypothetical protein
MPAGGAASYALRRNSEARTRSRNGLGGGPPWAGGGAGGFAAFLAALRAAIEQLGRHYGLFTDKLEHTGMIAWEQAVRQVAHERLESERDQQAISAVPDGNGRIVH